MHNLANITNLKTRRNKLKLLCCVGECNILLKCFFPSSPNLIPSCLCMLFLPQFLRFNICLRKETEIFFVSSFLPFLQHFKTIQKLCRLEISTNKRINDFSFISVSLSFSLPHSVWSYENINLFFIYCLFDDQ